MEKNYIKKPTIPELTDAFGDCIYSQKIVDQNIRRLNKEKKYYDRLLFEWKYNPDGWFLKIVLECDAEYIEMMRLLKWLKYYKRLCGNEVTANDNREKALSVRFEDVYDWQKRKEKRGGFIAICPLHDDKNLGNFNVFTNKQGKQIFKCFACGCRGDIISFIRYLHICSFPEAIKILVNM